MNHTPTPRERSRPHVDDFKPLRPSDAERLLLAIIFLVALIAVFSVLGYLWGRFA